MLPFKKRTPASSIYQIFTYEAFAVKILVFYVYKCTHAFDEFSRFLENLSSNVSSWFLLLPLSYTEESEKVKKKKENYKDPTQLRATEFSRDTCTVGLTKLHMIEVHSFNRGESSPCQGMMSSSPGQAESPAQELLSLSGAHGWEGGSGSADVPETSHHVLVCQAVAEAFGQMCSVCSYKKTGLESLAG